MSNQQQFATNRRQLTSNGRDTSFCVKILKRIRTHINWQTPYWYVRTRQPLLQSPAHLILRQSALTFRNLKTFLQIVDLQALLLQLLLQPLGDSHLT